MSSVRITFSCNFGPHPVNKLFSIDLRYAYYKQSDYLFNFATHQSEGLQINNSINLCLNNIYVRDVRKKVEGRVST